MHGWSKGFQPIWACSMARILISDRHRKKFTGFTHRRLSGSSYFWTPIPEQRGSFWPAL